MYSLLVVMSEVKYLLILRLAQYDSL